MLVLCSGLSTEASLGREFWDIMECVFYNSIYNSQKFAEVMPKALLSFSIFLQITKQKVSHKPTYESMQKSLEAMKAHCLNNGVTDISMPR